MKISKKRTRKTSGWMLAAGLLNRYLIKPAKADVLLCDLPDVISFTDRRYCQFLFLGVIRHKTFVDSIISKMLKKPPRVKLRGLLMVAIYEMMEAVDEKLPKIVDYAVESAKELLSLGEAKLVNAVLRKVPEVLKELLMEEKNDSKEWLAWRYSHPQWLVNRWVEEFGVEATRKLLIWDQRVPSIYVRMEKGEELELEKTKWDHFYGIGAQDLERLRALIEDGRGYIQDPSTSVAPKLAQVVSTDCVLDLCAAPGGKSMMMAQKLRGGTGQLVALDLPGGRIGRLRENLGRLKDVKYTIVEADLNNVTSEYLMSLDLPGTYDVVLLDAPCSNTGVLRRRVDAKWRLRENDILKMAQIQVKLLKKAASLVKPTGRLIYSTCSIENEENFQVVERFLESFDGRFECKRSVISYPWVEDCDGGGAFLFERPD